MILRVGLTGGIASGKSTIARMFGELGCAVFDADAIVAQLYRPGAPGHDAIVRAYGREILRPDGEIDRARLASTAFASAEGAQRLNALIHPLVIAEEVAAMRNLEASAPADGLIAIVEATLLLEAGGRQRYERIVVVDIDPDLQIHRAVSRGMTREDVVQRIANQTSRDERLRNADYVIDNSGDLENARRETRRVYALLRRDLGEKF